MASWYCRSCGATLCRPEIRLSARYMSLNSFATLKIALHLGVGAVDPEAVGGDPIGCKYGELAVTGIGGDGVGTGGGGDKSGEGGGGNDDGREGYAGVGGGENTTIGGGERLGIGGGGSMGTGGGVLKVGGGEDACVGGGL